jgi:amidase
VSIERLSLVEMAAQIRERKISPVEAVSAHLRRIEQVNPDINAFIVMMADQAMVEARRAEERLMKGEAEGSLFGVPLTIKDSLDVAGFPTRCGSRFLGDSPATRDSATARNFRKAGGILLGKTNTPEFLANYESDNHLIGRTNNPWNLNCTAGGSSGGEAAAIASFCSAGGMGSDGGGSVRVPAHFCGIAGLKPTPGRVSAAGHVPPILHPGGLLGVVGPMARSVRDVRALFEVCRDYDYEDPFAAPVTASALQSTARIGVMEQFLSVPVQQPIRDAVLQASKLLKHCGYEVDAFRPTGIERAPNVWAFFFTDLPSRATQKFIAGREDDAHWTGTEFLAKIASTPEPSALQVVDMLAERDRIRLDLLRQMQDVPFILLPVSGVTAFPHRQRKWETPEKTIGLFEAMMPVTPFNLVGFPGLTVPMAISPDGLPVGVQLVGRPFCEEQLLAVGEQLEQARGPLAVVPR